MSKIKQIPVLLLCLTLSSCGLIDMDFDPETKQVKSLTFTYDTVYVMVQDTFFLAPYIYPDSVSSTSIFWETGNTKVVKCLNDTILASGQGWTQVYATTMANNRSDTCTVCVMPRWEVDEYTYPYDMVVYAHILLDGKVPQKNWVFGTLDSNDQPRGMATPANDERTIFRFRIWSNHESYSEAWEDHLYFYAYNRTTLQMYKFDYTTDFTGLTEGTPSTPIELSLTIPLPPERKKVELN